MSSTSHYHTRKCMRVSVHVTFTLGVCNHLSQEFPVGKNKILCSTFDYCRQTIEDYGEPTPHVRKHYDSGN